MNNFELLVERAQFMGFIPIISPRDLRELQLESKSEDSFIRYIPRSPSYDSEINYYGWRLRKSKSKEEYVDIEFVSSAPLSIRSCCSYNSPGEFSIDMLINRKKDIKKDQSIFVSAVDISYCNTGHLLPVDWGIIDLNQSLVARVWPIKNDYTFLFAIFGAPINPLMQDCRSL